MSRSIKKGPFIDYNLEKKILAMNESGKKSVVNHGQEPQLSLPTSLDTLLQFTTATNSYLFTLLKTW